MTDQENSCTYLIVAGGVTYRKSPALEKELLRCLHFWV